MLKTSKNDCSYLWKSRRRSRNNMEIDKANNSRIMIASFHLSTIFFQIKFQIQVNTQAFSQTEKKKKGGGGGKYTSFKWKQKSNNRYLATHSLTIENIGTTVSTFNTIERKRYSDNITYQALDILAFRYVMYKMPVQRHNAVSSQMYHLNLKIDRRKQIGPKLGKYISTICNC